MQVTVLLTLPTKIHTNSLTKSLEELSISLLSWYKENKLKLNLDKRHSIDSGTENAKINLVDFTVTNLKKEKSPGIIFDDKLKLQYHIKTCAKKRS